MGWGAFAAVKPGRFRYLRGLAAKLTTDPNKMQELAAAYDLIEIEAPKLFQHDKAAKFSMYRVPLGEIGRGPNLGNPRSLMHDIYDQSQRFELESVGGLSSGGVDPRKYAAHECAGDAVKGRP